MSGAGLQHAYNPLDQSFFNSGFADSMWNSLPKKLYTVLLEIFRFRKMILDVPKVPKLKKRLKTTGQDKFSFFLSLTFSDLNKVTSVCQGNIVSLKWYLDNLNIGGYFWFRHRLNLTWFVSKPLVTSIIP